MQPTPKDHDRTFGTIERELIYHRDEKRCRVPGCGKEVLWGDAEFHHVEPHADGGATSISKRRASAPRMPPAEHRGCATVRRSLLAVSPTGRTRWNGIRLVNKHLRTCTRIERATAGVYKYGDHLTPGLTEVRVLRRGFDLLSGR